MKKFKQLFRSLLSPFTFHLSPAQGFTLIEMLLYLVILVVAGGVLGGVLLSVVRISNQQTSGNEVASQLNFAMTRINSLVKDSANIDISAGLSTSTLKLRMQSATSTDPTCISLVGGIIKLAQGHAGQSSANECTTNTTDLTTSKVVVDSLQFKKISFAPGHDQVSVDIQMSFNSTNPQTQLSRALHGAFSRVSAATFDDNLIPGSTGNYDVGVTGNLWRSINNLVYFSGTNVGIGAASPTSKLQVSNGNIYIATQGNGLLLRDATGSDCHLVTVTAGGTLTTASTTCP